jgi:hypothetical protein
MTAAVVPRMLEADWMVAVADALDFNGWAWIDIHPTRRGRGRWTGPQENSARGFPDVVACRPCPLPVQAVIALL